MNSWWWSFGQKDGSLKEWSVISPLTSSVVWHHDFSDVKIWRHDFCDVKVWRHVWRHSETLLALQPMLLYAVGQFIVSHWPRRCCFSLWRSVYCSRDSHTPICCKSDPLALDFWQMFFAQRLYWLPERTGLRNCWARWFVHHVLFINFLWHWIFSYIFVIVWWTL